jgi:hypothetical protein
MSILIFLLSVKSLSALHKISSHVSLQASNWFSLRLHRGVTSFKLLFFFRSGLGFTCELPLIPYEQEDLTEETRPMIAVHHTYANHVIRLLFCHWTAFDSLTSEDSHERLADVVRRNTYEYLLPEVQKSSSQRHIVILGDMNAEPTSDLFSKKLLGY